MQLNSGVRHQQTSITDRAAIRLLVGDATEESLEVEFLDAHRVRLRESPLVSTPPVFAGDVVEIESNNRGVYRLIRVLETPQRHHSWVVRQDWPDSDDATQFFASVMRAGGSHEVLAGGVVFVHIPAASTFDAEAELDRYLSSDWPDA